MEMIKIGWSMVLPLQDAFMRNRTFYWAVMAIMGFCSRQDSLGGVTSWVRCTGVNPDKYTQFVGLFHSTGLRLKKLTELWVGIVFKTFNPFLVTLRGCPILLLDGINIPKEGQNRPSVQSLHQASESNSKSEYIMGHFSQCVSLLVGRSANTLFSVPLFARIHLGTKMSPLDKRTLFDKVLSMIRFIPLSTSFYLVADSYDSAKKVLQGVVDRGCHIITRVKTNAVAYFPPTEKTTKGRGRPKKYGEKIKLMDLFVDETKFTPLNCYLYGVKKKVLVQTIELLSRRLYGMTLKYVLIIHPTRGKMILLSTDLSLTAKEIIHTYSYRFKIEVMFKKAIYNVGAFLYRFWMSNMDKVRRGDGTIYLHEKSNAYREKYFRKLRAYEIYVQLAFISQGIMQYLSVAHTRLVWTHFTGWIRTIRPNVLPSEMVVSWALRNNLIYFLEGKPFPLCLQKFIREKTIFQEVESFRLTG